MRTVSCSAAVAENLLQLRASLEEIEQINDAVKELAKGSKVGYVVPFQGTLLGAKEKLYQYEAGRFKVNYTLTKSELNVTSVIL